MKNSETSSGLDYLLNERHEYASFLLLVANSNVLVELGATEKSPVRSSTRIYTPLVVASPTTTADFAQATGPAQVTDSAQAANSAQVPNSTQAADCGQVEVITIDSSTIASATEEIDPDSPVIGILAESPATPDNPVTPILTGITLMSMDVPTSTDPGIPSGDLILPSDLQIPSPRLTQFLLLSQQGASPQRSEKAIDPPTNLEDFNITMDTSPPVSYAVDQPGPSFPNISKTRNEILALSNVLGRIPPSFLEGTDLRTGPEFSVSVIENPPIPPHQSTTETGLPETNYSYQEQLDNDLNEVPAVRNKRQRPRYSLKGSMLRKHPVLKFSAIGPIDREKLLASGGAEYVDSSFP